jgi:hypothetical protein
VQALPHPARGTEESVQKPKAKENPSKTLFICTRQPPNTDSEVQQSKEVTKRGDMKVEMEIVTHEEQRYESEQNVGLGGNSELGDLAGRCGRHAKKTKELKFIVSI